MDLSNVREEMIVGQKQKILLVMVYNDDGFDADAFKDSDSMITTYKDTEVLSDDDAEKLRAKMEVARIQESGVVDFNTDSFAIRVYREYPLE